eukprot:scaffold64632_cov31-Tisochrysis_lutea.AAC.4
MAYAITPVASRRGIGDDGSAHPRPQRADACWKPEDALGQSTADFLAGLLSRWGVALRLHL